MRFIRWGVMVALLLIPITASAHSSEWLRNWYDAWERRDHVALGIDPWWIPEDSVAAEKVWQGYLQDMRDRHPCSKGIGTWTEDCGPKPKAEPVAVKSEPKPEPKPEPKVEAPKPAPVKTYGVGQWEPLVRQYFAESRVERVLCLIDAESRGDPTARNPFTGASGLLQHLPKYWKERSTKAGWAGADIFDPEANIAVGAWLAVNQGWDAWSPWRRGECR